jgi:hypothetical protein
MTLIIFWSDVFTIWPNTKAIKSCSWYWCPQTFVCFSELGFSKAQLVLCFRLLSSSSESYRTEKHKQEQTNSVGGSLLSKALISKEHVCCWVGAKTTPAGRICSHKALVKSQKQWFNLNSMCLHNSWLPNTASPFLVVFVVFAVCVAAAASI